MVILAVSDSCLWPLTCEDSPVGGSSCTTRGSGLPAMRGHAACQPAGPMCRSQDLLSVLSLLPALGACGPPPPPVPSVHSWVGLLCCSRETRVLCTYPVLLSDPLSSRAESSWPGCTLPIRLALSSFRDTPPSPLEKAAAMFM